LAKNLICQVKITTRRSLHLRIANHTRRDVYVRLVGNRGRIAGFSPLRVSMETTNLRPQTPKDEHELEEDDEASGTLIISELTYSPCASMLPTPVDDSQGGVDLLFSSPVQSPARLLRELHADPDIQAQLEAERERDRAYERTLNACVLSVARFVAVVMGVLLVTVPTLLILLESDIDCPVRMPAGSCALWECLIRLGFEEFGGKISPKCF
uniref:FERM domain containing 3 n=1 Tax=Amphilophus citrinellus TaxID=61819 RepID=A0A3Q0RA80_AMPCI